MPRPRRQSRRHLPKPFISDQRPGQTRRPQAPCTLAFTCSPATLRFHPITSDRVRTTGPTWLDPTCCVGLRLLSTGCRLPSRSSTGVTDLTASVRTCGSGSVPFDSTCHGATLTRCSMACRSMSSCDERCWSVRLAVKPLGCPTSWSPQCLLPVSDSCSTPCRGSVLAIHRRRAISGLISRRSFPLCSGAGFRRYRDTCSRPKRPITTTLRLRCPLRQLMRFAA